MATLENSFLHYILSLCVFGTTVVSITNVFQTCNSPWVKVYENDAQGGRIAGDKTDLFSAREQGARIRCMIPSLGEAGYVEELDNVLAYGDILCGQSTLHVSKDRWDHFLNDGQWRFVIICTDGRYQTYKYSLGAHVSINETFTKERIIWFVQELTLPMSVYSHFPNGTDVSGNKDDLKNAVLSGYDVKFHINNAFILQAHNIEISENSGEVIAQNVWSFNSPNNVGVEWWFQMISSNGFEDAIFWNLGEHVQTHQDNVQAAADWFVDPCWRHAFTNDENGVEQGGSLANLIAAVELGHRVKVVIGAYSIELDNVRSDWGQVSGQLLGQVSKTDSNAFLDDTFWIWQMMHTTGTVRTKRYNIGDVTHRGDTLEKKSISWFVDTRPWRKILSTNKNGDVTFGSKADLKRAVQNGGSVRVGLQFAQRGTTGRFGSIMGHGRGGYSRSRGSTTRTGGRFGRMRRILSRFNGEKDHTEGMLGGHRETNYIIEKRLGGHTERNDHIKRKLGGNTESMLGGREEGNDYIEKRLGGHTVRNDHIKRKLDGHTERMSGGHEGENDRLEGMLVNRKEKTNLLHRMHIRLSQMLLRHKGRSNRLQGIGGRIKREIVRLGGLLSRMDRYGGSFVWDSDTRGWFVIKAENLEFGPDDELAAELIKTISTESVSRKEFQIKDDPFWKFMLVTTESKVDIAQWRVGDHIDDGHFSENANVNWFVNY